MLDSMTNLPDPDAIGIRRNGPDAWTAAWPPTVGGQPGGALAPSRLLKHRMPDRSAWAKSRRPSAAWRADSPGLLGLPQFGMAMPWPRTVMSTARVRPQFKAPGLPQVDGGEDPGVHPGPWQQAPPAFGGAGRRAPGRKEDGVGGLRARSHWWVETTQPRPGLPWIHCPRPGASGGSAESHQKKLATSQGAWARKGRGRVETVIAQMGNDPRQDMQGRAQMARRRADQKGAGASWQRMLTPSLVSSDAGRA